MKIESEIDSPARNKCGRLAGRGRMDNTIKPGNTWLDSNGNRIHAHGGAIFYEKGLYYWYGENKERTDGVSPVWTWGIRFYSSRDLYNWKDEGLVIPPVEDDTESPLHPFQRIDRPHILFNKKTGKYVLWFKTSGDRADFTILASSSLLGKYEIVKERFRPLGKKVGDFDLAQDEESGRAYLYFDADHKGLVTIELTEDYCGVRGDSSIDFTGLHPPFCREGITHFVRNGKHYILTSGMTGYIPNPSEIAMSGDWFGPFETLGNPHVDDASCASFNSQISSVFKHPKKKDLYIALADRWVPGFKMHKGIYDAMVRVIGHYFNPYKYSPTVEDQKIVKDSPMLASADTSLADYVWLPLRFEGDMVYLDWKDEWRIEDYP